MASLPCQCSGEVVIKIYPGYLGWGSYGGHGKSDYTHRKLGLAPAFVCVVSNLFYYDHVPPTSLNICTSCNTSKE